MHADRYIASMVWYASTSTPWITLSLYVPNTHVEEICSATASIAMNDEVPYYFLITEGCSYITYFNNNKRKLKGYKTYLTNLLVVHKNG